jgi:exonuclease III
MNVRCLFSNTKKRSDVFNWVKAKKISIVCFQETHSTKDVAVKWEDEWGSKWGSKCFFLVMVIVKVPE